MELVSDVFSFSPPSAAGALVGGVDDVIRVLLHHDFNYQSRGRVAHLLPQLKARLRVALERTGTVPVYFLYHGGYRASVNTPGTPFSFSPDVTEWLLLYQVARLHRRLKGIGVDGLRSSIVINNGVAHHTNGIPYAHTESYVFRLRELIQRMGATGQVSVLAQSELGGFDERMSGVAVGPKKEITPAEHAIVERFLGCPCSVEEACQRAATYEKAEEVWGAEMKEIVGAASGFFCRQVAHPECLSFRPFPGAAIRVQNGVVGFRLCEDRVVPVLVTPKCRARLIAIPLREDRILTEDRLGPAVLPAVQPACRMSCGC